MLNQQETVRFCIKCLKEALSRIEADYFRLVTTDDDAGIVRERVFCYELYHQVRQQELSQQSSLRIHAEIDKSGHKRFDREDWKNPDFVFHVPGDMGRNTLIVEVKGGLRNSKGRLNAKYIRKDFETLITFVRKYHYAGGAFTLFNHDFTELKRIFSRTPQLSQFVDNVTEEEGNNIYVLTIKEAHKHCEEYTLNDLRLSYQSTKLS